MKLILGGVVLLTFIGAGLYLKMFFEQSRSQDAHRYFETRGKSEAPSNLRTAIGHGI